MRIRFGSVLVALCALAGPAPVLDAQEMDLPVAVQWSLLDKILMFDRSFEARTRDGTVVGVLYQSRYRASLIALRSRSAPSP